MSINILLLCQAQFGSHIDTYIYCKFLSEKHGMTYLCWDYNLPKQDMDKVATIYVSRSGNIIQRNLRYLYAVITYIRKNPVDICFIKYFRGCFVLRLLFPKMCFVFDIRTGSVRKEFISRCIYNSIMRTEALFFKNVTVISQSLAKKFRLQKKAYILPLGSVHISNKIKSFATVRFLYVGTLSNRHIEKTVLGFDAFLKKNPQQTDISYTIIGDGYHGEVGQLQELVKKLNLHHCVKIIGPVPFDQLGPYFDTHNIGVSFVPMTPYFDVQPVTKTFDYLLSGMPVLGTATSENQLVINEENGILIQDTAESFCRGLEGLVEKKESFCSQTLMNAAQQYHWKVVVKKLDNYFQNLLT